MNNDVLKTLLENPETRVRMALESYVKFDGTENVTLQNAYSENALRIQSDILLILFEMTQWKSMQELLAPWPPGDQEKIKGYLDMFHQAQLLEIEGHGDLLKSLAKDDDVKKEKLTYNKIPINVENHHNMLKDNVRLSAYRRAIEQAVKPGSVVLDMGAGTGVLSFFASKAGAAKVYAVERRPHIVTLAEALAQANGLDNIEFIEAVTTQVDPNKLEPRPNVLVAEIIGDGILEENILEYTMDVRDRLLLPGAALVPCKIEVWGFAFYSDYHNNYLNEVAEFKALYNLDFDLLGKVLASKATLRRERYHPQVQQDISAPERLYTIDFRTVDKSSFSQPCQVTITKTGRMSGLCLYFKAWLTEDTCLTNSPWAPSTHWTQLLYGLAQPQKVQEGDTFEFDLVYDGALRIALKQEGEPAEASGADEA